MELPSVQWLYHLGMDDPSFIHQCEMSTLDQFTSDHIAAALGDDFQTSFSSESYTSYPSFSPLSSTAGNAFSCSSMQASQTAGSPADRPAKLLKTSSWGSCTAEAQAPAVAVPNVSSPSILSFSSNRDAAVNPRRLLGGFNAGAQVKPKEAAAGFSLSDGSKRRYEFTTDQGVKRTASGTRPPSHTQDHIIAERKRREKLSQRFIALSTIVPGLKKMDKASVLGDAIRYVKQLQERVKTLEDQAVKQTVESAILVKKTHLPAADVDETSSSDENFDGGPMSGEPLLEIEAKISDGTVLLRVHCEKRRGVLVKMLAEVERLHLTVVNTSVMPFAGTALDITVIAQVDEEFSMTVKDIVKHLNSACRQFM